MKTLFAVGIVASLLGCTAQEPKQSPRPIHYAKMKNCIDECVRAEFSLFHSSGQSWGEGSSSMAGVTQGQIFDRILDYCEDFYSDEKCCEGDLGAAWNNINTIHGVRFGACK